MKNELLEKIALAIVPISILIGGFVALVFNNPLIMLMSALTGIIIQCLAMLWG